MERITRSNAARRLPKGIRTPVVVDGLFPLPVNPGSERLPDGRSVRRKQIVENNVKDF